MARDYLVPRAVRARFEFSPGWGWGEVLSLAAGGAIGFALQWGWGLLHLHGAAGIAVRLFLFTLPAGAAFLASKSDAAGGSLWQQYGAMRAYRRRPHLYLYQYRGWSG